jgi:hypothetical protein
VPPEDYDFDFDAYEDTDWETVEGVELYFDEDGGADLYMLIDGELIDFGTIDPGQVSDVIWNDLYEYCQDYDIPFEVEEDYA